MSACTLMMVVREWGRAAFLEVIQLIKIEFFMLQLKYDVSCNRKNVPGT